MARFYRVVIPEYPHNIKKPISLFITSFIFAGVICMSTAFGSGNDFTNYRKAWFTIEFEAQQMGLDIRVNDIPVFNIDNTGLMTLEVPINQFIINGDNEIKVIAHPLFDEDDEQMDDFVAGTKVEVGLYIRDDGEPAEKRKLIDKVLIRPDLAYLDSTHEAVDRFSGEEGSENNTEQKVTRDAHVLDYPGYGNFKKQVVTTWDVKNVSTNFPRWAWQDGKEIIDDEATYNSLLAAYKVLYDAFQEKDLHKIEDILHTHSSERAVAFHLKDAEAGFDNLSLERFIDHPTIKLHGELFVEYTKLDIFGNNKLARIMSGAHTQPIAFIDEETDQPYLPQFIWYKNSNNEWIQIR